MCVQFCIMFVLMVPQCALHQFKYVAESWENPKLSEASD